MKGKAKEDELQPMAEIAAIAEGPFVGIPHTQEAFITSAWLRSGQTVVLTILHKSKINSQTLKMMADLTENTEAAILNVVSLYRGPRAAGLDAKHTHPSQKTCGGSGFLIRDQMGSSIGVG